MGQSNEEFIFFIFFKHVKINKLIRITSKQFFFVKRLVLTPKCIFLDAQCLIDYIGNTIDNFDKKLTSGTRIRALRRKQPIFLTTKLPTFLERVWKM